MLLTELWILFCLPFYEFAAPTALCLCAGPIQTAGFGNTGEWIVKEVGGR